MKRHLAIAMMGADRFILINALEEDAKLHDTAMRTLGMMPDFAIVDELPELLKCGNATSGMSFKPVGIVENNNWRKSKKRGFNGYHREF